MKKILYLIGIVTFVGIYIGLYFFYIPSLAESTFEQKRESLQTSIKRQIKEAWNNKNALLYFKDYGGAKFLRMDMDVVRRIDNRVDSNVPAYGLTWNLLPNGRYATNVRTAFNSLRPGNFNDLYDLYYIQSIPWRGTYVAPDDDLYNIKIFTYTPLFVGYKKETMSLRDYRPSFDKSCKEAKEYIQEEDADNRMYYDAQNEDRANKIFNLRNDYYYFQFRDNFRTVHPDNSYIDNFDFAKFNFYNHQRDAFPFGNVSWVYNGFYKVYYLTQKIGNMYLAFNDVKYEQDIESYLDSKRTLCNILFSIFIVILVCLLLATHFKNKKTKEKIVIAKDDTGIGLNVEEKNNAIGNDVSVLYDRVLQLSNPELFIKPYQPEKLEKANRIYSSALKNQDNIIVLEKLLEEAIQL